MPSKADLAKIHIAKKELGLDDTTYRDILQAQCGKVSASMLTPMQAAKLLRHFERLGWKPKGQRSLPGITIPTDAQSRKCLAIWIQLHKAGKVRDGSDRALLAFVKRVTRVDRLEWCTMEQRGKVIDALKEWAKREGVELDG